MDKVFIDIDREDGASRAREDFIKALRNLSIEDLHARINRIQQEGAQRLLRDLGEL